ncbi:hypothetical protein CHS0354_038199 [Potamilus streckersoni]|uniref:Uncharacterized protein n=1 Tax=Potamilus streckersoni TaxID=2493646 RepID=A0AAE0T0T9_9BIVA|nr:hypothetical protein CHS0354_038199 [Potamilus streckersoni]
MTSLLPEAISTTRTWDTLPPKITSDNQSTSILAVRTASSPGDENVTNVQQAYTSIVTSSNHNPVTYNTRNTRKKQEATLIRDIQDLDYENPQCTFLMENCYKDQRNHLELDNAHVYTNNADNNEMYDNTYQGSITFDDTYDKKTIQSQDLEDTNISIIHIAHTGPLIFWYFTSYIGIQRHQEIK